MNWDQLKNKIYVWNGGWLDIYVHGISAKDWEKWTQLVNQKFKMCANKVQPTILRCTAYCDCTTRDYEVAAKQNFYTERIARVQGA